MNMMEIIHDDTTVFRVDMNRHLEALENHVMDLSQSLTTISQSLTTNAGSINLSQRLDTVDGYSLLLATPSGRASPPMQVQLI